MNSDQKNRVRDALRKLPEGVSHGEQPRLGDVYLPVTHLRAIDPNRLIVTGMRGAGKTFWWSALQSRAVRNLIQENGIGPSITADTEVYTGYGVKAEPEKYPSRDTLRSIVEGDGVDARIMWRAVQAWQVARNDHPLMQQTNWKQRVHYSANNPESIDRIFLAKNEELRERKAWGMILFDALDQSTDSWSAMYHLIRGLLQTALEMRSYSNLRVKVFLRTDQLEENSVLNFPDSSKVIATRMELKWSRVELYNLMWHYILGGDSEDLSRIFRNQRDNMGRSFQLTLFPEVARYAWKESRNREEFHKISGPWMGRDRRRGFPYTWIPNHLSDAAGNVSPRSFLCAIREAAIDSENRYPDSEYAIHYQSIKRGVQEASTIRVFELREDYPWVHDVMSPLKGSVVPCHFEEISSRWKEEDVLDGLTKEMSEGNVKLPPRYARQGPDGIRRDLEELGLFERMRDGRVNIPDVFRVGYGLGRRGGVKPVR